MRGIIFAVLTLVLGGVLGLGLEKLASFLPMEMANALTRTYMLGIHPLVLRVTICGVIGLILGYLIVAKFVKK
mgnify:FL=1